MLSRVKRKVKAPGRSRGSGGCTVGGRVPAAAAVAAAGGGGYRVGAGRGRGICWSSAQESDYDDDGGGGGGGGGPHEDANACFTGNDGDAGGRAVVAAAAGRDVAGSAVGGGEDFPELALLPDKLRQRLLPFQKQGVKFALEKGGRCMIADEMGLGKTLQAIAVAYIYRAEWPMLVVVPSSLKYLWIEELEKWVPELLPGDIHLVESKTDVRAVTESRVTVLGYGLLTADATPLVEALQRRRFQVVLVDESHYVKTRTAMRSRLLVPLVQRARRALLLSGTPAFARPEELYMQIDALYPNRFGKWTEYTKRYCAARMRYFGRGRRQWDCTGASNLSELHGRLGEFMIRRLKDEVLTQLPPKIRQRIPFNLSKEATKEVTATLDEWLTLLRLLKSKSCPNSNGSFVQVMNLITRLFQQTAVAKAGAVKDYIKMLLENDSMKFLVFAHHLLMLQACTEAVVESKVRHIRIDGSVPAAERTQLVHQFQNDASIRVAVLSIKAAGQGLTFTAATNVVFAELYWDPGHMKQAEDRAHRIGQCSSVHIHYLVANGTLDPLLWSMINRKTYITSSTLNGRLEQLGVQEVERDKCDFLSHALAWVPSDTMPEEEALFFTQREKDRQPDIRGFLMKPTPPRVKVHSDGGCDDDSGSVSVDTAPDPPHFAPKADNVSEPDGDNGTPLDGPELFSSMKRRVPEGEEFKPQNKKFRLPVAMSPSAELKNTRGPASLTATSPAVSHASPHTEQQGRSVGKSASASALRRKCVSRQRKNPGTPCGPTVLQAVLLPSGGRNDAPAAWDCRTCTFSNNGLMRYCEMCDAARPGEIKTEGKVEDIAPGSKTESVDPAPIGMTEHAAPCHGESEDSEPQVHAQTRGDLITVFVSDDDEAPITRRRCIAEDEVGQTLGSAELETNDRGRQPTAAGETSERAEDGPSGRGSNTGGCSATAGDGVTQPDSTGVEAVEGMVTCDVDGEDPCQTGVPAFDSFMFCASRHTDRVFLFTADGQPLHCNFIPLDVKLENWDELPDILRHKRNRALVQRFVREWDALPPMKQRILRKSGQVFRSPGLAVEELCLGQKKQHCTKRFLSKTDVAERALSAAEQEGGSVRHVAKPPGIRSLDVKRDHKPTPGTENEQVMTDVTQSVVSASPETTSAAKVPGVGFLQALDGSGRPLCLGCSKPTLWAPAVAGENSPPSPDVATAHPDAADWTTRFCSYACQEDFNLRSYNSCVRGAVRGAERGVCRECGLDAQELFSHVRGAPRPQRKALLEATVMAALSVEQLNEMIRNPRAGQFWQADHIRPVWNGGGQCHLDNLQTLCTVCHEKKTNKQEVERKQMVKRAKAAQYGTDITLFFQKK